MTKEEQEKQILEIVEHQQKTMKQYIQDQEELNKKLNDLLEKIRSR